MAMARSKDLFDDTTMTFGEHLEALRMHLFKAVIGLVLALVITLAYGNWFVDLIRRPIDAALTRNKLFNEEEITGFWSQVTGLIKKKPAPENRPEPNVVEQPTTEKVAPDQSTILVHVKPSEILRVLHSADPARFPAPQAQADEKAVPLAMAATEFREFRQTVDASHRPITLNVQEAFMMYIKVAFVAGFIIASPWIFYQMWQFVAAGLYRNERRYVHLYLPLSVGLFLLGVFFAFYLALPMVLDFLLSFNRWLGVVPQIRLSEWVSFVILLPVMFGVSFQLPLIMLFVERIGIVGIDDFRSRRRLAIFAIAVASMMLSPGGDIGTMLLMFVPLVILYEFGILLCSHWKTERPFDEPAIG
jgi:sec-independent protein translocase protein TatC